MSDKDLTEENRKGEDRRQGDRRQNRRRTGRTPFDPRIWGFEDRRKNPDRRSGVDRRGDVEEKDKFIYKPLERDPMEWEDDTEW